MDVSDLARTIAVLEETIRSHNALLERIEKDSKERDTSANGRIEAIEKKANAIIATILIAVVAQVLRTAGIG